MSADQISTITPVRRDVLFAEIKRIVNEAEAVDRALEPLSEAMAADEALEQIADLFGAELRQVRRARRGQTVAA